MLVDVQDLLQIEEVQSVVFESARNQHAIIRRHLESRRLRATDESDDRCTCRYIDDVDFPFDLRVDDVVVDVRSRAA